MAYIYPTSRIDFFEDLGLAQDYNDSLYFPTTKAKDDYFSAILQTGHTVLRCSYVREKRGFVRVELPMSLMVKIQYMRFKNSSFEDKWWYAFVKDVNYINNNTTEVEFEIDPLMCWMGEFELAECFVERQHSLTDNIGDNLVDEPLNTGDYVKINDEQTGFFDKWVYAVFYTNTAIGEATFPDSRVYDQLGIYSGLSVRFYDDDFDVGGQQQYTSLLALHTFLVADGIIENVQFILHIPDSFIPCIPNYVRPAYNGAPDYSDHTNRQYAPVILSKNIYRNTTLDGNYQPNNNKLFTHPYNYFTVWCGEGRETEYKYELFSDPSVAIPFEMFSNISESPEATLVPVGYRGIGENFAESVTMKEFTHCAWASDAFMAYIAQTLSSAPVRLLAAAQMDSLTMKCNEVNSQAVQTTKTVDNGSTYDSDVQFANGNSTHLVVDNRNIQTYEKTGPKGVQRPPIAGILAVRGSLIEGFQHLTTPASVHGSPSNPVLEVYRAKDFWFYQMSIRKEYAQIIDGFFTMYGYAQKKVMKPEMHARQRFTYVETKGCKIHCNCPASDADFIEGLFNRGIRFWTKHTDIGKYDLGAGVNPNPLLTQGS